MQEKQQLATFCKHRLTTAQKSSNTISALQKMPIDLIEIRESENELESSQQEDLKLRPGISTNSQTSMNYISNPLSRSLNGQQDTSQQLNHNYYQPNGLGHTGVQAQVPTPKPIQQHATGGASPFFKKGFANK